MGRVIAGTGTLLAIVTAWTVGGCRGGDPWTILTGGEAAKLSKPCSRPFPEGLHGAWEPAAADVARAEAKLSAAIDAAFLRVDEKLRRSRPATYFRQYGGFLRNGSRVLFVNAIGKRIPDPGWEEMSEGWRGKHLDLCDGGTSAFGAVYDPGSDRFDSFFFSGRFEGRVPGGGW